MCDVKFNKCIYLYSFKQGSSNEFVAFCNAIRRWQSMNQTIRFKPAWPTRSLYVRRCRLYRPIAFGMATTDCKFWSWRHTLNGCSQLTVASACHRRSDSMAPKGHASVAESKQIFLYPYTRAPREFMNALLTGSDLNFIRDTIGGW